MKKGMSLQEALRALNTLEEDVNVEDGKYVQTHTQKNYNYSKSDIEDEIKRLTKIIERTNTDKESAESTIQRAKEFPDLEKDQHEVDIAKKQYQDCSKKIKDLEDKIEYWKKAIYNKEYTESYKKSHKKSSIKESYVVDTDNRDASTTVLELDNGDTVEVDPCELFANMLANNYEDGLSLREIEDIVNNYLDAEDADSIKVRIMIE